MPGSCNANAPIRIGTAGWGIPPQCREQLSGDGSQLERYARTLNCAEINSTFYRSHRKSTYARWAASVPSTFAFSVKMPKAITHEKRCAACGPELRQFFDETSELGARRRVVLMQLPPRFAYEDRMQAFFEDVRSCYDGVLVCEPRHASWFTPDVSDRLASMRIGRVAADPSRFGCDAAPGGWSGVAYYRQHGSPRTYYSSYQTVALAHLANALARSTATERWCIFDNTASGAALSNALDLYADLAIDRSGYSHTLHRD